MTLHKILIWIHCKNFTFRHTYGKAKARLDKRGMKKKYYIGYTQVWYD